MSGTDRAGFSLTRLARIDRVLKEKYVDTGALPGTLTQVWRRGELVHNGMNGVIDIERRKPMREDAIFRIYSMTKPIVAVAIMMLVEEGRIGLADDVATWIPAWKNLGVYAGGGRGSFQTTPLKRPMRVIDLATHTAGFTYRSKLRSPVEAAYAEVGIAGMQTEGGLEGMMAQLAELPLLFSPGDAWNYSIAIDVLGYIVQKASGQTLGEFLRKRIFEPLGMVDTAFWCPPEKLDRFASCYAGKADGPIALYDDSQASMYAAPPKLESGGGGLVGTAADYMRFCRMMLNRGSLDGAQILSPKSVALFSVNYLPGSREMTDMSIASGFDEAGYAGIGFSLACGVNVNVAKTRLPGTLGEFFWGGAAATAFWIDPKEDLAVVFMTQVRESAERIGLRRTLRTLVYSAFTESFA
ncbi:serine hydrolase domain-containing protein [soil metagenome]